MDDYAGIFFGLLIAIFVTSLTSCAIQVQNRKSAVMGTIISYPSNNQTCVVQDNTIATCFNDRHN